MDASGGHSDTEHIIDGGYVVGGVDTIKGIKVAVEAKIWRELDRLHMGWGKRDAVWLTLHAGREE